jgi:hypothetical protein
MKPTTELLTAIAREHLHIDTLESRNSDSLDFHSVSVWGVKDALQGAYRAGVNDCRVMSPTERRIWERMQSALTWLLDDLSDAEEDRHPETGEEYDSVAFARAALAATKDVSPTTNTLPPEQPVIVIEVRGGLIEDIDADGPVNVVVEDWDVEDFDTEKRPARNVWKITGALSAKRQTKLRALIAND